MIVARKCVTLIGALSAVLLTVGACSGQDSESAAPTSSVVDQTSTVGTEPEPSQSIAIVPGIPPTEVSDLKPTTPTRPSLDSGNVDPTLFASDPSRFGFTTPTGNIQCSIWAGGSPAGQVGCQARTSVNPASGRTCTNAENDKFAVRVNDGGAQHICTTQGIYTSNEPRVLEYGQVLSAVGVVCSSDAATGITCWGTQGGFTFSRDINVTF